jgi:hypothetical protein
MLGFVIKLACFDTCPKLSESNVFNIFGSKIKDRDKLLEDQVEPLIFVANTGESSSEFDSDDDYFFICLRILLFISYLL